MLATRAVAETHQKFADSAVVSLSPPNNSDPNDGSQMASANIETQDATDNENRDTLGDSNDDARVADADAEDENQNQMHHEAAAHESVIVLSHIRDYFSFIFSKLNNKRTPTTSQKKRRLLMKL